MDDIDEENLEEYINKMKKELGDDIDLQYINIDPDNIEESIKNLNLNEEISSLFDLEDMDESQLKE